MWNDSFLIIFARTNFHENIQNFQNRRSLVSAKINSSDVNTGVGVSSLSYLKQCNTFEKDLETILKAILDNWFLSAIGMFQDQLWITVKERQPHSHGVNHCTISYLKQMLQEAL